MRSTTIMMATSSQKVRPATPLRISVATNRTMVIVAVDWIARVETSTGMPTTSGFMFVLPEHLPITPDSKIPHRFCFSWSQGFKPIHSTMTLQVEEEDIACMGGLMPRRGAFPWLFIDPRRSWPVTLALALGCARTQTDVREALARRIDPGNRVASGPGPRESSSKSVAPAAADAMVRPTSLAQPEGVRGAPSEPRGDTNLPPAIGGEMPSAGLALPRPPTTHAPASPDAAELDAINAAGRPLTLTEAIELAFRYQPRLRIQLEGIAQARGRREIVASTFLPIVGGSYSVGAYDLGVGGQSISLNGLKSPGFNFLPGLGALPVGLSVATGYELAELKVQWLVCDFGRRLGRLEQAKLALDVAGLQTDRAFQTVSNEVAVAYYGVLRSQAFRRSAQDANRRAEEELEDARKLEREGVVERETVLRAEVLRAEIRQQLHAATEGGVHRAGRAEPGDRTEVRRADPRRRPARRTAVRPVARRLPAGRDPEPARIPRGPADGPDRP